jgi:hypothetical protein
VVDLLLQVFGREVSVDIRRHANVGVPQDALNRHRTDPRHDEQGSSRVPEVMEPERRHPADGPQLHLTLRTSPDLPFSALLGVTATSALVDVALDDSRPA